MMREALLARCPLCWGEVSPPHIPMPPDEDEDSVCSVSDFMSTESNLADICEEQDPNHPLPPVREVPVTLKGTFAGDVLEIYLHREPYLMNSYAIAGMVCSPAQIVMDFLRDNPLTGEHRRIVNCHVRKLCRREMPTLALQNIEDARVQCTFWEQQRKFQDHLPPFDDPIMWVDERRETHPHLWAADYVCPYADIFGYVQCKTTSKPSGPSACERVFGHLKQLKDNKRSHLGSENTERATPLYGSYCAERDEMKRKKSGNLHQQCEIEDFCG